MIREHFNLITGGLAAKIKAKFGAEEVKIGGLILCKLIKQAARTLFFWMKFGRVSQ